MIINTLTSLYFLEALALMAIGLLAFMRMRSKPHLTFFFFALATGIWQMLQAFSIASSDNSQVASWLFVASISFTSIMTTALFLFTAIYTGTRTSLLLAPLAIIVAVMPIFSEGLRDVAITSAGIGIPRLDAFYAAVLLYDVTMLVLSVIRLIMFYRMTTSNKEKARTTIMLSVTGLAGIIIILSSFYTSGFSDTLIAKQIVPITNMLALLGFLYAIVYRDLFDIHVFVLRATAYISSYFILAVLLVIPFVYVVSRLVGFELGMARVLLVSLVAVVTLYLFQLIKNQLDRFTARYFFRKLYDPQALIDEHNSMLVAQSDAEKLLEGSAAVIDKYIQPERVVYWLKKRANTARHLITTGKSFDLEESQLKNLMQASLFVSSPVAIIDNLSHEYEDIKEYFTSRGIAVVARLTVPKDAHHTELGYLLLGFKKSGDTYGSRDEQTLQVMVNELVMAIQSANRFEEIRNFNVTLQEKVDRATAQLRQNNKKLHEIDKSKDEFISMASHQLRTPLTSIKGYISMILDGDIGRISKEQRTVLEQAFDSSQRMVFLIGDFLNVSRIQTGKFMLEVSNINLPKLVQEEVDQLTDTARTRQITLAYERPSDFPVVIGDDNKLRQVMMNLMDNAIFYSDKSTSIQIQLYRDGGDAVFKVIDSGIGVPRTEQPRLFTKFYRASNARQQRPDGTGIGLYMAKKIIVEHGGSVVFETKEGVGSTFGFRLPLKNNLK